MMLSSTLDACSYEHDGPCTSCEQPCASDQCRGICDLSRVERMPLYAETLTLWLCELARIDMALRCKRQGRNGACRQHSNMLTTNGPNGPDGPDLSSAASILMSTPTQWRTWLLINTSISDQGWLSVLQQVSLASQHNIGVQIRLALMIAGAMVELNPLDKLPLILRLPSPEERVAMDQVQDTNQRFIVSSIINVTNDALRRVQDYSDRRVPIADVMPLALLALANEP